jgi:iron complex outermembrane receptor protein
MAKHRAHERSNNTATAGRASRSSFSRSPRTSVSMTIRSVIAALLAGLTVTAHAMADTPRQVTIPAGDLVQALEILGEQSDVEFIYSAEQLRGIHTNGVNAILTTQGAVKKLLEGTPLRMRTDEATGAMLIAPPRSAATPKPGARATSRNESSRDRLHLAQADQRSTAFNTVATDPTSEGSSTPSSATSGVEEVIVTAQKKFERLMDVPVPVSVLNADTLASNGQLLLREYYNTVPGLNLATNYGFTQNLAIRGVTTGGFANPTVAITVDDVPYSGSTNSAGGNDIPDIDPGDLARIEILRGPQGALYGANSMGGLIKYVTRDPSFSGYSGRVEVGSNTVHGGDDAGYVLRASANLPVSDRFAMRVSGFTRRTPGYIDNPVLGIDGINEVNAAGGRVATLWNISADTSLKLSALFQHAEAEGLADSFVQPGFGDLQQNYMPGIGGSERRSQAYSAIFQTQLGSTDFISITGYSSNKYENVFDRSVTYGALVVRDLPQLGVNGVVGVNPNNVTKLTEEVRFSATLGEKLEWVFGGFFMKENTHSLQRLMAANRTTGEILALELLRNQPIKDTEYAAFVNVTYHFTDRFDVQLGGRDSQNREDDGTYIQSGPFIPGGIAIQDPLHSKVNTFTYLVTPRFRLAPQLMLYARFASGYRPGGPNFAINYGAPPAYEPDTTNNYEVGFKGDLLDGALSLDASLYYIDWKDIQLSLRTPPPENYTYLDNASRAVSKGIELSVNARPFHGTNISGWVAFNDAKLTEAFPAGPTFGPDGSRLPNTPRTSGYLSLQQEFPLWGSATGYVEGAATYVGERLSLFTGNAIRQVFPSYTKADLRAGMNLDSWSANVYVSNLTDERGVIGGGIAYQPSFAFVYIQPRTIGLSISRTF